MTAVDQAHDTELAAAALAIAANDHGERAYRAARDTAYLWQGVGHRLDGIVRDLPAMPAITYLDETGEERTVPLLANTDLREVVTELLTDAIGRIDAYAVEMRRHAQIARRLTAATLAELGVTTIEPEGETP